MERLDAIRRRTGAGDRSTLFARTPLPPIACYANRSAQSPLHTPPRRPPLLHHARIPHLTLTYAHATLTTTSTIATACTRYPARRATLRRSQQHHHNESAGPNLAARPIVLLAHPLRISYSGLLELGFETSLPAPREVNKSRGHACRTISQDTVNHCADTEQRRHRHGSRRDAGGSGARRAW